MTPSRQLAATLLLLTGCVVLFQERTAVTFRLVPWGDAAYYADMTQSLYFGTAPQMRYPTMHSRRILAPSIVAVALNVGDAIEPPASPPRPAFLSYEAHYPLPLERNPFYPRMLRAWHWVQITAFFAIGLLTLLLVRSLAPTLAGWQVVTLVGVLALCPSLGRLYFAWPFANDLVGIALGLASLALLTRGLVLLSALLLGLAALARENLFLVYPAFVWVARVLRPQPPRMIAAHAALAAAPYLFFCLWPLFPNVVVFYDLSTGLRGSSAGAIHDYLSLVGGHVGFMLNDPAWPAQRIASQWLAAGPLLLLTARCYPWSRAQVRRDWLLWGAFLLCAVVSFRVDRYLVYGILPLLLLAPHVAQASLPLATWAALVGLYVAALRPWAFVIRGEELQVETTPLETSAVLALLAVAAVVMILLDARRARTAVADARRD